MSLNRLITGPILQTESLGLDFDIQLLFLKLRIIGGFLFWGE